MDDFYNSTELNGILYVQRAVTVCLQCTVNSVSLPYNTTAYRFVIIHHHHCNRGCANRAVYCSSTFTNSDKADERYPSAGRTPRPRFNRSLL